VVVHVELALT